MFLKQLEIQGFKSFPDKTRVAFERGITAVVGPNGSGKSNISDAIRWVMGETSSRQLRAAGKMEDVIFGGTARRSPMGYASVSLTIDNRDHGLDMDAEEVVIGRKLYRSGESVYSINGQAVRLKDVYELLLDTGLGRDGYSIISQGRIAEIVGAKSAERREIFEEASGIARYRYRKTEAEKRLAGAEENLERLNDILGELKNRVGPLERESRKAERFLELAEQRKGLEVTLWLEQIRRSEETARQEQRRYETAQADHARLTAEIAAADERAEGLRRRIAALGADIDDENARIRAVTEEAAGAASRLAVLENERRHHEETGKSLQDELAALQGGESRLEEEKQEANRAVQAAAEKAAQQDEALSALEEELASLTASSAGAGEEREAVTLRLAACTERETALKVETAAGDEKLRALAARREAAREEQKETAARLAAAEDEGEAAAAARRALEEKLARLDNMEKGLALKLQSRQGQLEEAERSFQEVSRQLAAATNRIEILRDLEKNMDGYQESVRAVVRAGRQGRLPGILGTVSSVFTVKPGYETAVETALGYAAQNIIVESERTAKAGIALLKSARAGRATFLPLDTVQGTAYRGPLRPGVTVAADLVSCEARFAPIAAFLLGRILVAENLDEAALQAKEGGYRNRVVTLDGQVVNAGGSFTGGSTQRSAGLFTRRQELAELTEKQGALEAQAGEARAELGRRKAAAEALAADRTATRSESITAQNELVLARAEEERLSGLSLELQERSKALAAECEALAAQEKAEEADAGQRSKALAALAEELEALSAQLTELSQGAEAFLAKREELSRAMEAVRLQRAEAGHEGALAAAALENLSRREGEGEARRQAVLTSLEHLAQLLRQNEAAATAARQEQTARDAEIAAHDAAIRAAAAQRLQLEEALSGETQAVRRVQDEREGVNSELGRLAERQANAEAEHQNLISRLWEDYQLTPTAAAMAAVPFESAQSLRQQVAEVRAAIRSLGNVNVGAIEEYREVKERYDFLSAQVSDVEKSKAALQKLIANLSSEMKAIFTENFARINGHFDRIFRHMFGGGSAALTLTDPDNVLESGIEISVSPPGKVIRSLSALSGGEQALVAISIYFAILAVNPSPFCILDEIEAALDDVNVVRYAQYLRHICEATQFIVITHRRGTMEEADVLYGVTMQEEGVSRLLRLDLSEADASLVS